MLMSPFCLLVDHFGVELCGVGAENMVVRISLQSGQLRKRMLDFPLEAIPETNEVMAFRREKMQLA